MSKIIWNQLPKQVKAIIEPFKEELTEKANTVLWNNLTGRLDTIYLELNALYPDCINEPNFYWYDLPRKVEVLKSFEVCSDVNFDVEGNWIASGIIDKQSFIDNNFPNSTVGYFNLTGNRLRAKITELNDTNLQLLAIEGLKINFITIEGLQELIIIGSGLQSFDPILPLPDSLIYLLLSSDTLTEFNPTLPLPSNLGQFLIENSLLTEFNPSVPLPQGLYGLDLSNNQLTEFNPSLPLPTSLIGLSFENNLLTTASYTNAETWANLQPSFLETCQISFEGNVDSVVGTDLETILTGKNATVTE